MLAEGTIIDHFMLTKLVSQTPLAHLFQSIHVDTGERYLTKIAGRDWVELPEAIQSVGFEFRPGLAVPWKPSPADILARETALLTNLQDDELSLPRPAVTGEFEGLSFTCYSFFDGVTLDAIFASGTGFTIQVLIKLLQAVDRLSKRGLYHGNLQPSTILVGGGRILLMDITQPATAMTGRPEKRLLRCITVPEFYPFLDPRHDQLAMGILLYTLVAGKHPLALEALARDLGARRRAKERFARLVDEARERGANRFLSPLLSFVNPTRAKDTASEDFQELVLRTLGFARRDAGTPEEGVDVLPDTWLDNWLEGNKKDRDSYWTLADTAEALSQAFAAGDQAPGDPLPPPAAAAPPKTGADSTAAGDVGEMEAVIDRLADMLAQAGDQAAAGEEVDAGQDK